MIGKVSQPSSYLLSFCVFRLHTRNLIFTKVHHRILYQTLTLNSSATNKVENFVYIQLPLYRASYKLCKKIENMAKTILVL